MDQPQKPTRDAFSEELDLLRSALKKAQDKLRNPPSPDDRKLAVYALVHAQRTGASQREILDAIENEEITPVEFLVALKKLQGANELDHLMELVWSGHFRRS